MPSDITILGSYANLTELTEAHPVGTPGEAYLVGEDVYVWPESAKSWVNVGLKNWEVQ